MGQVYTVQIQFIISLQGRIHDYFSPFYPVLNAFSNSYLNLTLQVKAIIPCPATSRESVLWGFFWFCIMLGFGLVVGFLFVVGFVVCWVWVLVVFFVGVWFVLVFFKKKKNLPY